MQTADEFIRGITFAKSYINDDEIIDQAWINVKILKNVIKKLVETQAMLYDITYYDRCYNRVACTSHVAVFTVYR